jgi:hypothetical protein
MCVRPAGTNRKPAGALEGVRAEVTHHRTVGQPARLCSGSGTGGSQCTVLSRRVPGMSPPPIGAPPPKDPRPHQRRRRSRHGPRAACDPTRLDTGLHQPATTRSSPDTTGPTPRTRCLTPQREPHSRDRTRRLGRLGPSHRPSPPRTRPTWLNGLIGLGGSVPPAAPTVAAPGGDALPLRPVPDDRAHRGRTPDVARSGGPALPAFPPPEFLYGEPQVCSSEIRPQRIREYPAMAVMPLGEYGDLVMEMALRVGAQDHRSVSGRVADAGEAVVGASARARRHLRRGGPIRVRVDRDRGGVADRQEPDRDPGAGDGCVR